MVSEVMTELHHQVPHVQGQVIIIGDVHGCVEELKLLVAKCAYNHLEDVIVLVGDLVNKGPSSVEVIEYAHRELKAYAVRGNHDESALAFIDSQGGRPVDPSHKYAWTENINAESLEWFRQLPYTLEITQHDALVVHAGIIPNKHIRLQRPVHMTKMRNIVKEGDLYHTEGDETQNLTIRERRRSQNGEDEAEVSWVALEGCEGNAWASRYKGPQHIYFGHDARRGLQLHRFATGLDTGCCYGRELSACILPARKFVSVEALRMYSEPVPPSEASSDLLILA